MVQKYFVKATEKGMKAAYDGSQYHMGENVHPNPNLSKVVCGRGYHLARTIYDTLAYVPNVKEFYLATAGRILGSDGTKIRTNNCTLLIRIPQYFIDDYEAKRKAIYDDYVAKRKAIDRNIIKRIIRFYKQSKEG